MIERFIHHVTLDTGNVRRSPRSEVADAPLEATRVLLNAALRGGEVEVMNKCFFTAARQGKCLLATVFKATPMEPGRAPLVTIGVAGHSKCGPRTWRLLHERAWRGPMQPLATDPEAVPEEPWCAARLEIGAVYFPDEMHWLADFERCLAWAFLDEFMHRFSRRAVMH